MNDRPPDRHAPAASLDDATLDVLRRRAEALAAPVETAAHQHHDALVLEVDGHRYALPVERVRRILRPGPIAAVPRGGHHLVGVRAAGGEPIAVADLGAALRGRPTGAPNECLVVVLDDQDPLGLLADRVDVAVLDLEADGDQVAATDVVAMVAPDGTEVLDVERLVSDPRFRVGGPPVGGGRGEQPDGS